MRKLFPLLVLYLGLNLNPGTTPKLQFKLTKSIAPWIWVKMRVRNDVSADGTTVWNPKIRGWYEVDF